MLIDKYKESEAVIRQYKTKSKTGIYIVNFINTIEYDNAILKDQIDLYINYLFFFQDTQTTYLSKLNKKMVGFLNEIEEDIKFQNGEEDPSLDPSLGTSLGTSLDPSLGPSLGPSLDKASTSVGENIGIEIVDQISEESKIDKRRGRRNIITKS